jgi:hypothetical protein
MELTVRNADLQTLATMLKDQEGHKADAIVKATALRMDDLGVVEITGTKPLEVAPAQLTEDGVTPAEYLDMNGRYELSETALRHLAERFGIDLRYARKLAEQRPDILADNVNGWIHGHVGAEGTSFEHTAAAPDPRSFTVRTFHTPDGNLLRGVMSDKYSIIDNLDVLNAVFAGIKAAGYDPADPTTRDRLHISGCDLTENRMRVRVTVPAAVVAAPLLFAGYRNPFHGRDVRVGGRGGWTIEQAREAAEREGMGYEPGTEPIMYAGFEFGNGELGDGATYVVPRAEARICKNGLVLPLDAARKTHVGERLEEGVINWSGETRKAQLDLITRKVADAVRTFASVEFWAEKIAEIEAKAAKPVTDADQTIKAVAKTLRLTEPETTSVLDMFIHGGQMTAGGVLNAVTAAAQTVPDPDRAAEIERLALRALETV